MSTYRSRAGAAKRAVVSATDAGLVAAAAVPFNEVRTRLFKGYTTGNFATGGRGVAGRVMTTDVFTRDGVRVILVGTERTAGYPYELAWELGFNSIFSRKYERVEVWRPALMNNRERIRAAFARAYSRALSVGGSISEAAD